MDVTRETEAETKGRLARVLAAAEVTWLPGSYEFKEVHSLEEAGYLLERSLGVVRDGAGQWSALGRAGEDGSEVFCVFQCHFDDAIPNSGFVGWLASELKRELGTGVFVVCGQNRERGGVFDYWGLPLSLRLEAQQVLERLGSRSAR